jgi:PTH1 family peptidyl-tRNA hydrolase
LVPLAARKDWRTALWLIVGLGNPGMRYRSTRHNIGFMLLDRASALWGGCQFHRQGKSMVLETSCLNQSILLLKPQTMMNLSGLAVQEALQRHAPEALTLVVVYDDCHLPLGKLRIRERGSAGGHHGIESIIGCIGNSNFLRLRLGIADETMGSDMADYVLRPFPKSAREIVEDMLAKGVSALESLITAGAAKTMSMFN